MTPEERAVINTAIEWRRAIPGRTRDIKLTIELERVIWELIISCQQCNHDTHRCGGCGAEVGHGEYTCSDCEEPPRLNVPASTAGVNDPLVYAHDPHCNAQHEAGPQACPLPEPEIHTASTVATAELSAALERQRDELIWHPRTMKDARKGDQIRPAGSDMPNGTAVTDRYWPPQPAVPTRHGPLPADRDTWHVVPGAKHWDDHVVQPGEVWLCLDGGAPRNVDPDFPIEILLTRAEIAAIELLGWDNREETRS